jgi:hypothetical protein
LRKPNRQATARGARPTMTMAWARKAGRRFDFPCESLWATHPISEQYLTVSGTSPLNIIKLKKINLLFTRSPSSPPHTLFQTYKKKRPLLLSRPTIRNLQIFYTFAVKADDRAGSQLEAGEAPQTTARRELWQPYTWWQPRSYHTSRRMATMPQGC